MARIRVVAIDGEAEEVQAALAALRGVAPENSAAAGGAAVTELLELTAAESPSVQKPVRRGRAQGHRRPARPASRRRSHVNGAPGALAQNGRCAGGLAGGCRQERRFRIS